MINHFASQSQTCQLLIFFFFFLHSKEIVKSGATSGLTDEHQLQIWSTHSLTLSSTNQNYLFNSIGVVYNGHVKHIFTLCHSRQTNVATWFLVFPIDIKNKSTIANINIYRYIYAYIAIYRVFGIIFSRSLRSRWKQWYIEIYGVGDNWRTVNPSTSPHISGQLGTNNPC